MQENRKINDQLTYTLIRKSVKNINLRIDKNANIVVTANRMVEVEQIDDFVRSKSLWIQKAIDRVKRRNQQKTVASNAILYIFNKPYTVQVVSGNNRLNIKGDVITLAISSENQVEKLLKKYLETLFEKYITETRAKMDQMIQQYQIKKPTIGYRYLRGKWGVCTPKKGHIVMSYNLVHYPKEAIDYVLLHEYVHLIVPNHSKRFYDVIFHHMSDYKVREAMLK